MRALYKRFPLLQRLSRALVYGLRETMAVGITRDRRWLKGQELNARLHLRRQVPDPELRERLTPDYEIFCKRIILSNRWYPAIQAPNVDIVGSGVSEVREHSVIDGDGVEREIDTLVFATGFRPAELAISERIHGRDGRSLAEVWQGSPEAYLGTTVTGFPNLLFLYGPNTNLGHSSIVYILESQIAYALDALDTMDRLGAAEFDVRPEAQAAYNQEVQERLARSVWNTGGCASWYIDRNGRNSIQWPGFTFEYRRRTRRFDTEAYRLAPAA
jgi:cation diffusion facilitator CzcD-associated flavoprotein CzcO